MSKMFADHKAYEKLAELKKKDLSAWEKFKEAIKKLLDNLKELIGAYDVKSPGSDAAMFVEGFTKDMYDKLQDLYIKAFASADEKFAQKEASGAESDTMFSDGELDTKFINDTLDSFEIQKPGDYIHVQRQVLKTLAKEGFFTDAEKRTRTDTNKESGMVIETNKSGIDETFNLKNYARLGIKKKIIKLSTVRMLPDIISNGKIIADDVDNQYGDGTNKKFAYITHTAEVSGSNVVIKIDIKKITAL